jgi:N6-L-threonylcarbamoyladenine synthase
MNDDDYDFSFSGLKTAVKRIAEMEEFDLESLACEFETAVVDVLVEKIMRAAKQYEVKSILLGGGVSANLPLRQRLEFEAAGIEVSLHVPPIKLCTDNALYIASAAYFNQSEKPIMDVQADPGLGILDFL